MKSTCNLSKFSSQRATLSDMLPFEIPPSFGNGGFFNFLSEHNVNLTYKNKQKFVEWDCEDESCDETIKLIFNTAKPHIPCLTKHREFGKNVSRRKLKLENQSLWTHPFHFEIAHKENDSRRLSIIHPRNQLEVANFYHNNASLITYHASLSPFSLRKPASVAKDVFYDDKLHKKRLGEKTALREESHKEYQYLASYFTYEKYSNVFRFYESYGYQKAEKTFSSLLKLDVSKCFDSIYTHSLPWALLGKMPTKDNLSKSKNTFAGRFDQLLQNMNNGETNGIVIGPEFSRIFAELILQKVDNELKSRLSKDYNLKHKVDYEIFRYVDDFFIFYSNEEHAHLIERSLSNILREFKLNLNSEKAEVLHKPIITNLTIAKNRVQNLLKELIEKNYIEQTIKGKDEKVEIFTPNIKANKLIVGFKTILKETDTTYQENLNYTFAAIEKAFKSLISKFKRNRDDLKKIDPSLSPDEQILINAIVGLLEFSFFIYSSSQRVNFTVRLTRSISFVVDALNELKIADDLKNQVFKYAHDNIIRVLKSNKVKKYREIETLYLVLALKKLGKNYRINEKTLANYFSFSINEKNEYQLNGIELSIFSITVLLLLIRNIKRYEKLKSSLEKHILNKFMKNAVYVKKDSEMMMLYLDIIACPFVSDHTKCEIDKIFGLSNTQRKEIFDTNRYWFTNWQNFDLTLELDKKRARQVY